jgi:PAS domain S-box-containing protein
MAEKILSTGVNANGMEWPAIHGWYLPDQVTLLTPEQLPLVRAVHGERVSDELIFVRGVETTNRARGQGAWIRVNGWPLRDADGSVCGGVVMFHDFTEGRKTLQTLSLLSRVVEQTADNVILTDRNGVIQYVNPAFETTTGYRKEEVLGQTPRLLKSGLHDAGFYRELWQRLQDGQSSQGMIINRKKNGELYWAQQAITPIRDEWGHLTHFVSVLQDITDLRKQQEHEFQLQLARDVQRQFYAAAPVVPGFDIGAAANPAYETGGDYFDFIPLADGSLVIAVGDVEGHGFGSALVMALTRAYLRSFVAMELNLDEILAQVNRMLFKDLESGRFVTLALARIGPATKHLAFASAGHVSGFLLPGVEGEALPLESTGPPLGLFAESKFEWHEEIPLEIGQTLVLMTDGAAESAAPDGTEFGTEQVLECVREHRAERAQSIADGIYAAARNFVKYEPQADDITSVVIKVTG